MIHERTLSPAELFGGKTPVGVVAGIGLLEQFSSAKAAHVFFFGASVTTVFLFFFVVGRVLNRLDERDVGGIVTGPVFLSPPPRGDWI